MQERDVIQIELRQIFQTCSPYALDDPLDNTLRNGIVGKVRAGFPENAAEEARLSKLVRL